MEETRIGTNLSADVGSVARPGGQLVAEVQQRGGADHLRDAVSADQSQEAGARVVHARIIPAAKRSK